MAPLWIKLALADSGDDYHCYIGASLKCVGPNYRPDFSFQELKRRAVLLSLGEDSGSSAIQVDTNLYKVALFCINVDGDKSMITSASHLQSAMDHEYLNRIRTLQISVSVEKNDDQECPTLEPAAESSTQPANSATSASIATLGTHAMCPLLIKLALAGFGDDTVFHLIPVTEAGGTYTFSFEELKKQAILLLLGEDPSSSTTVVDDDLYKVAFVYIDVDEDKIMIASDSHLRFAMDHSHKKAISLKIFASVENKKDTQKSPTLEPATKSATEPVNSATSASESITTLGNHEMVTYIVKLALVGSGDDVVFRRIKYATNPGRFESMTERAIWLYLGGGDAQVDLDIYKVTFFYTDSHGDKVTVESDSDIFSAASQFTKGGLKVFANVQRRHNKSEVKDQADLIADAKAAEEQKQADADVVVQNKEEETCAQSETSNQTASEEEQAGSSDEEESDDETADSMPPLAVRKEYQMFYPKAASPIMSSVPNNVDIVSKGDAEPSFASDAEGSEEIAAVLGETLDRVAQAIDDMHLELDRTSSAEKIQEIVGEDAKDVNHESWREELDSKSSEPGEDVKDDCSHDSWNVVSDQSDDAAATSCDGFNGGGF